MTNKISFWSILLLVFLLPIFFIPSALVPLGMAKVVLITLAALVSLGAVAIEMIRTGRLALPSSKILWFALILLVVYGVSALASSTPALSFSGIDYEIGTAASIILLSVLFLTSALSFHDKAKLVRVYTALFVSFSIVALLIAVKLVSGGAPTFGVLNGVLGNPAGSWTDLAGIFGILSVLAAFALEMLPLGALLRAFVWIAYVLSLALLAVVGFTTMWAILLGAGLVLLVYFITVEKPVPAEGGSKKQGMWAAAILSFVALIFVWNPTFSSRSLSAIVSDATGINNIDVRPSLSTTLAVSHAVLSEDPLLGSGPNTFDRDWQLHKSPAVNGSIFWNAAFPFGYGFLSTAVATTGALGTLSWIAFLALFIGLGVKALNKSPEHRADRFILLAPFLTALLLWTASFFFVPSIVLMTLAFVFTGLFVAALRSAQVIGERNYVWEDGRVSRFVSTLALIALTVGAAAFAYDSVKKNLAVFRFERALAMSAVSGTPLDTIEEELIKAVRLSPNDQYWLAISQVELARANDALSSTTLTDVEKQTAFQDALTRSIASIQNAIALNPTYTNWIALGNLYESLVPAPFSIEGAYDSALSAYTSAKAVNPSSPELALLLARLEIDHKNVEGARAKIDEALALKPDYAGAYFLRAQLEANQNNLGEAIRSAETGVLLTPNNAGVLFELGLLKFSAQDYVGAEDAFQKALAITPDYANAKYYLGLSLDQLGRKAEALAQFEDLAKTNPDNAAVMQVLENLRAGKSALSQTPASTQKPTTAPISGQ